MEAVSKPGSVVWLSAQHIRSKKMAATNDIVLIYLEDKPFSYARIEDILNDSKPDWYHVKLMLLLIPLQVVTWILKENYINGEEFTMNGKKMRLEPIQCPEEFKTRDNTEKTDGASPDTGKGQVISFKDLKKDKSPE